MEILWRGGRGCVTEAPQLAKYLSFLATVRLVLGTASLALLGAGADTCSRKRGHWCVLHRIPTADCFREDSPSKRGATERGRPFQAQRRCTAHTQRGSGQSSWFSRRSGAARAMAEKIRGRGSLGVRH